MESPRGMTFVAASTEANNARVERTAEKRIFQFLIDRLVATGAEMGNGNMGKTRHAYILFFFFSPSDLPWGREEDRLRLV
jgi:hypothetical protein